MIRLTLVFTIFGILWSTAFADTEYIYISVGDPGYDKIYYNTLPKNVEKTWIFTTEENGQISFACRDLKISSKALCRHEELIVDTGIAKKRYCATEYNVEERSEMNKMKITLKTSNEEGYLDCLVQAVSGPHLDQYQNIESTEMDSSEFGVKKGITDTTCSCGWSNKNIFQDMARIVNGKDAEKYEFPWMAAIRRDGMQFCGGSIITEYHILTAAHCTIKKHNITLEVLVGTHIRWAEMMGQRIKVKQIVEHKYDKSKANENDIAILILEEKINFNDKVGPVCLPTHYPNINNQYVTIMGWGNLQEFNSEQPDYLKKANVRVVDMNTCSYKFNRKFPTENPTRICTWSKNRDTCMGDSGGPLVWLDRSANRYTQIGLVSYGRGCNTPNPKVFTAVSHYFEWITKVVEETRSDVKVCTKVGK